VLCGVGQPKRQQRPSITTLVIYYTRVGEWSVWGAVALNGRMMRIKIASVEEIDHRQRQGCKAQAEQLISEDSSLRHPVSNLAYRGNLVRLPSDQ
jgi:hypothetical protein